MLRFPSAALVATAVLALASALASALAGPAHAADPRRIMHGITAVAAGDGSQYVFFSAGPPPERGGSWHHDVHLAAWNPATGRLGRPRIFIGRLEAQEPVSAARAANGNILVTFEDGWDARGSVTQRYGVYDARLDPVRPYPQEVKRGAHSGHAAAVGDRFVVFYSDEWVQGGGVDDLGSGYGVYAKVFDARGEPLHQVDVAHERREWWPVVAGGANRALLVWQRFVPREVHADLLAATLDPATGELGEPVVLDERVAYYTYGVAWLPAVERFLVVGSTKDHSFAHLLDESGEVVATLDCMPGTVREAGIAVRPGLEPDSALAFTPSADGRLLRLRATRESIAVDAALQSRDGERVSWQPTGSVGLFADDGSLTWVSLSDNGLVQTRYDPGAAGDGVAACDPPE